ncbi:BTAD domain-containing putative transcriptional regulator [Kineococcus sp. SYSU DK002]|uniref:BTAD domain-containing putative transcriptional regulator n=1 Tax=Kineococcus sp. SYSU DK002 TaxID=3383123 RepID=UPI003D7CE239
MLTFGVLGPLVVESASRPVTVGGPRHRAVLARLLIARGRTVPAQTLIEDLWERPPGGALGALQTFVAALRRALEPDRPPRAPAHVLVTSPPGYALRLEPGAVDAWTFETVLTRTGSLLAQGTPDGAEQALQSLQEALDLWRGPAHAEFADTAWARGEAARLEELRLLAVERRAEVQLTLPGASSVVADLEAHVAAFPLREEGARLLALALYRAGRQGEALAELRRVRAALRTEAGLDPSPLTRRLHADVLAQAPHLDAPTATRPRSPSRAQPAPSSQGQPPPDAAARGPFVGRVAETGRLEQAAHAVTQSRAAHLVLVSGAAGAGKSTLAAELGRRLRAAGWLSAWGDNPGVPGAPAAWPWTRIRHQLDPDRGVPERGPDGLQPTTTRAGEAPGEGPASVFERTRALSEQLRLRSAASPVLLVLDDLHRADDGTLATLTALAAEPGLGPVLLLGAYRSDEVSPQLAEALARAARTEPSRLYLAGLADDDVARLARSLTSREMPAPQVRELQARSGGNPFFVRELCRLWDHGGGAGFQAVPTGVRDVIHHRLSLLSDPTRTHLRRAAVLGPDVDVALLTALTGEEDAVLDSLEDALRAGFLEEGPGGRLRFAHDLVREAVYGDTPQVRRARWHAAAAQVLRASRPDDVEVIASHLVRAGDRAPVEELRRFTRAAATRAEERTAPREAARLWRAALDATDEVSREQLEALMGLVRSLAVTGQLQQARSHRARALRAAEALGDPRLTATVLGSFDVPALWSSNDDEQLSARVVTAARRALAAVPDEEQAVRARLLITIAVERRADHGPQGADAAREAERIARRLQDPLLLALALNARFLQTFSRAGLAPRRAATGEELVQLSAGQPHLATFEVLGHLIALQGCCALGDLAGADAHAQAVDALAERHDLPVPGAFTAWYAALRSTVRGSGADAESAYRRAAGRLVGTGMTGLEDGILPLALLCSQISTSGSARALAPVPGGGFGPYAPWVRPLLALAAGDEAGALEAARAVPDSPRDLLLEVRLCLHAATAVAVGDRRAARRLHDLLLPAGGQLAGGASGLLTCGPVDWYLGALASFLGHPERAAEHYQRVVQLAGRLGADRWSALALGALEDLAGREVRTTAEDSGRAAAPAPRGDHGEEPPPAGASARTVRPGTT